MFVTLCMLIRKAITKGCKALKAAGRMKQRKRTCLLLAMLQIKIKQKCTFQSKKIIFFFHKKQKIAPPATNGHLPGCDPMAGHFLLF